ncbi:hypothetical protein C2845_PM11G03030 [Panicum miliaceum]|uniref:U-box domain-containing protein n=1 Tax=Panicum miliaceum TaxID=4540 RepID=A0A3L6RPK4_PANMI|nr:hypothetical protein C2845_PM11G03030 [Panicum miliaceum]
MSFQTPLKLSRFLTEEDILDHSHNYSRPKEFAVRWSLVNDVMVDPVTLATGESFGRQCIKSWFEEKGHICPVTNVPVSAIVLRNERIRDYLVEWRAIEAVD